MSNIKINGQDHNDLQIVKLKQDKVKDALANLNSAEQGADDVMFKVGSDTFVATGRNLFPGKLAAAEPSTDTTDISVTYQGKAAKVLAWDNQANNGKECLKWGSGIGILAAVAPLGIGAALGTGITLPLIAIGAVLGGAICGAAYLYGAHRKMDPKLLAQYGTVEQENTQSKGGWKEALTSFKGK
jgi:hypothetical protein